MDPVIAVVVLALGVGIGWAVRGLWPALLRKIAFLRFKRRFLPARRQPHIWMLNDDGRVMDAGARDDHSGRTAMDADKITFTVPGKTPELPPSHDTPQNREIMERMNEPGSVQERQGDDRG